MVNLEIYEPQTQEAKTASTILKKRLNEEIGSPYLNNAAQIYFQAAVPKSAKCRFCESELAYTKFGSKTWFLNSTCHCDGSDAYWNKYQAEYSKINKELQRIDYIEHLKNQVIQLNRGSQLGQRFFDRTFETFEAYTPILIKAFQAVKHYAENFENNESTGKGLILLGCGHVGTGKTHLASAITNYLITEKLIEVKQSNITNLLGELKNTYDGTNKDTEYKVIHTLSSVRLLVIDDLGKEKLTEWALNVIYTVINNRYENYKPMVITTEKDFNDLNNLYGNAIISRIIECCQAIKMTGEDYRKKRLLKTV